MKNDQEFSGQGGFGLGVVAFVGVICVAFGLAAGVIGTLQLAPSQSPAPAATEGTEVPPPAPVQAPPARQADGARAAQPRGATDSGVGLASGLQIAFNLLAVAALGWLVARGRKSDDRRIFERTEPGPAMSDGSSVASGLESIRIELEEMRRSSAMRSAASEPAVREESVSKADLDALNGRLDNLTRGIEKELHVMRQKSLEEYFAEWKDKKLAAQQRKDTDRILEEFETNPEVMKTVAEVRQTLTRVREKTTPLAQHLMQWTASANVQELARASSPLNQAVASLTQFSQRAHTLVSRATELERRLQLSAVGAEADSGINLFDVVSGRSATLLGDGYRHRLAKHLSETEAHARALAEDAEKLRGELPALLDAVYREEEALVSAGGRRLDLRLNETLAAAKINEIVIEPGRTRFDAAFHEALGGATEARTDLLPNTVVRVDRRGFTFEGKTLRAARVVLSAAPAAR
jgi:hypothetical protein